MTFEKLDLLGAYLFGNEPALGHILRAIGLRRSSRSEPPGNGAASSADSETPVRGFETLFEGAESGGIRPNRFCRFRRGPSSARPAEPVDPDLYGGSDPLNQSVRPLLLDPQAKLPNDSSVGGLRDAPERRKGPLLQVPQDHSEVDLLLPVELRLVDEAHQTPPAALRELLSETVD